MHGTFDHNKVSVWIRMLTKLVDYAKSQKTKDIRKMILTMDKDFNYLVLLKEIFEEDLLYLPFKGWQDIKHSVSNLKSAFIKPETLREIIKSRDLEARYFKGVK